MEFIDFGRAQENWNWASSLIEICFVVASCLVQTVLEPHVSANFQREGRSYSNHLERVFQ